MVVLLLICIGVSFCVITLLQVISYRKLKSQTKVMMLQSQEIKKQMHEVQLQNQKLEELNNEKQQIIGVVSHDLKGPFNRIFALIQLMSLTGETFTEEQREYLGKIHQIVADGLGMVRNLLDNRRLEDRGLELTLEDLNASIALTTLVRNYRVLSEKKKIQINFVCPPAVWIHADKIYFSRIIDNLLTNAIKFSPPEKSIFVVVSEDKGMVEISVRDEGPGISPEDKQKLFQKYQRLTPRPTGGESSTGLGLYLTHAMITKMDGAVFCDSDLGTGATFRIQFKAALGATKTQLNK